MSLVAGFINDYLGTRGLTFYNTLPALTTQTLTTTESKQIIKTPYFQAPSSLVLFDLQSPSSTTVLQPADYLLSRLGTAPSISQEKPVYQIRLLNHTFNPYQGLEITAVFGFSDTLPTGIELAGTALAFKLLNQHLERKGANTWDGRVLLEEQLITTSTDSNRTWATTGSFTNRLALQSMLDEDSDFQTAIRKWAIE